MDDMKCQALSLAFLFAAAVAENIERPQPIMVCTL
jgi:hypothetical protein